MIIDESLLVHDASATLAASPFDLCRGAANTLAPLKGLRIGAGWNKRVRELLGGAASCTHIVEMLGPMATTVYQGLAPQRLARMTQQGSDEQRVEDRQLLRVRKGSRSGRAAVAQPSQTDRLAAAARADASDRMSAAHDIDPMIKNASCIILIGDHTLEHR